MDDFVLSNLHNSRDEWSARLLSIFTPLIAEGIKSIFNESWKLCVDNDEANKYLMTFQNLLSRVPKWNNVIVEEERKRIIERSGCNYLEDLISCVHIIQLKVLTCIRVGNKQKKIDISIPKLDTFIHKIYINTARKVYMNVYLFEKNISPLRTQRNSRDLETMIQECILAAIRESIPTEDIIRAYMDENTEHEEEVIIENIEDTTVPDTPIVAADEIVKPNDEIPSTVPSIQNIDNENVTTRLTFNDMDSMMDDSDKVNSVSAPKTIERLEELSTNRAIQRKLEEEMNDYDEDNDKIKIHTDMIDLSGFDMLDDDSGVRPTDDFILDGVDEL